MSAEDLIKIFNGLHERFKINQVQEDTTFYFSPGEETGEKWTVTVGPERCEVKEGKQIEQADCFFKKQVVPTEHTEKYRKILIKKLLCLSCFVAEARRGVVFCVFCGDM